MTTPCYSRNMRILIVDDNESIHDDFKKILNPDRPFDELTELDAVFFDKPKENKKTAAEFELYSAYQGAESLELVRKMKDNHKPFAMAFVDMRMPPGWDGLETISRIWEVDEDIQVVICTAYSDHSWDELVNELGRSDRLLILKKPFDNLEVRQLACALTKKWNLQKDNERAHRELENLVRQLEKTANQLFNRNTELEEFTYLTSHDMQEPLRKLSWFTEMLSSDMDDGQAEQVANDIHFINEATQRMQVLVSNIIRLSKVGKCKFNRELISLAECAKQAIDNLRKEIDQSEAQIVSDTLPRVMGDSKMLSQLYTNLIENSIRYAAPGEKPYIHLTAEDTSEGWIFGVHDNSVGIKAEDRQRVFSPFIRLQENNEYQGTGIGLAICRKTVERHNGRIWVESEPGKGCHFKFTISNIAEDKNHMELEQCLTEAATKYSFY